MRQDYNVMGHDYTVKQHDFHVKRHDYTVKRHDYNDKRNDYKYSKYDRSKANQASPKLPQDGSKEIDRSKLYRIKSRMKKIIPKSRIDRN